MRKGFLAFALLCVACVLVFFLNRPKPSVRTAGNDSAQPTTTNRLESRPERATIANRANPALGETNAPASNAIAAAPVVRGTTVSPASAIPPLPEFTNFPAATVLENMRSVFHQYNSTFGGNPVGTNPEITQTLNGGNSKGIKFIKDEDGLRINGNGELVDPWGTPFFFHQLSGTQMEIHSAGPDRVMWTADDLVVK